MATVKYQPVSQLLLVFCLALLYGSLAFLRSLWTIIKIGPSKYFYVKNRGTRPSCLEDPSLGKHQFVELKTGVKIHYVVSGPEDKPLMVFVHGFPEFWYSWRNQIREFNKDYRCVAYDMRGFGESSKPRGISNYIVPNMVEDLKELIIALGYDDCVLVSHDWGGIVAFTFAMKYPDMVTRFITCNIPHPAVFLETVFSSWKQFLMSGYIFYFQMPWLPEISFKSQDFKSLNTIFRHGTRGKDPKVFSDEDIEAFKFSMGTPGGLTNPLNYYRAIMRYKYAEPEPVMKMPALMVWGKKDRALSAGMAERSGKYLSDFTLHYIPESGHWVQQEEPEQVNRYMREFLDAKK